MRVILILLVLTMQGCMSTEVVPKGPVFSYENQSSNSDVTAYFYHFDMPGVNSCLLVGINDNYKGCIGYPGFLKLNVASGEKEISFTPNSPIKIANLKFDFEFQSGTEYFFKYQLANDKSSTDVEIETQYNMLLDQTYGWYLIEKKQALSELRGLQSWHKTM